MDPTTCSSMLNGVDVSQYTIGEYSTTEHLIIDAYVDIPENSSVTLRIDIQSTISALSVTFTKVYIVVGYAVTSTTLTDIITINLDPANDTYKLRVYGNFTYRLGVRWWVYGNRKTTATSLLSSTLSGEVFGLSNLNAGDDGGSEVLLRIGTGDYSSSFTIRGSVGAEGDVVIVTRVYCQVVLRGNLADSYGLYGTWFILIRERGVFTGNAQIVSITGQSGFVELSVITYSGKRSVSVSSTGTDVRHTFSVTAVWDMPESGITVAYGADIRGELILTYISIVIIGE
jgi:hypothetical protein